MQYKSDQKIRVIRLTNTNSKPANPVLYSSNKFYSKIADSK